MSNETLQLLCLVGWAVVALIIVGVRRELEGKWSGDEPLAVFWPLVIPFMIVVVVGWCVVSLGRALVRIIRARRQRSRLPRAEVRR